MRYTPVLPRKGENCRVRHSELCSNPDLALSYIKAGAFAPEDFIKVTVSFAKLVDKEDTKAAIEGVLEFLCYAREVCEANNDDDDELTSVLKEAGVHYHSTK